MDDASFRALLAYNWETKLLDDVYRSAVKKCGLPECAFWILYTLRMEPDSFTQARICEFLREPKQTVNSALKKLEAGGYLTLSPGADQRSKPVRLTDSGLQLAHRPRGPHPGGGGRGTAPDDARGMRALYSADGALPHSF